MDYRTKSGKFLRLPYELKERLRAEFNEVRNEYELANLGSFEQLYPIPQVNEQATQQQAKYE